MSSRVPITVHLERFEGPLDLLLYLIQSHELDITKISISVITDQYLAYVRLIQELNFDTASEFLVMAATLLQWKSKAILPQDEKVDGAVLGAEEFSQDDLIRQLFEHQRFLEAGANLGQLPRMGEDVFTRNNSKPPIERIWRDMDITSLAMGYQDMLVRQRKRTQILKKETVSLSDKILEFSSKLTLGKPTDMRALMSENPVKPEVVVTFLASLELSRLKKMRLHQEITYSPILIELLQTLQDFDLELASGFDDPNKPREAGDNLMNNIETSIQEAHHPMSPKISTEMSPETSTEINKATSEVPAELLAAQAAHTGSVMPEGVV
jgi:segregation and condensation protein A